MGSGINTCIRGGSNDCEGIGSSCRLYCLDGRSTSGGVSLPGSDMRDLLIFFIGVGATLWLNSFFVEASTPDPVKETLSHSSAIGCWRHSTMDNGQTVTCKCDRPTNMSPI